MQPSISRRKTAILTALAVAAPSCIGFIVYIVKFIHDPATGEGILVAPVLFALAALLYLITGILVRGLIRKKRAATIAAAIIFPLFVPGDFGALGIQSHRYLALLQVAALVTMALVVIPFARYAYSLKGQSQPANK